MILEYIPVDGTQLLIVYWECSQNQELPVRLAHRVAELENLPHGLSEKSRILKV